MASSRITGINEHVSSYGSSGVDFTALATWEAQYDIDLVTATTSEVLECRAGTYDDTVAIAGATVNSSYRRIIRAASTARHRGIPSTGVRFAATTFSSNAVFNISEDFLSIQDIVVSGSADTASSVSGFLANGGVNDYSAVGIIIDGMANAGTGGGVGFTHASGMVSAYLVNCLAINVKTTSFAANSTATGVFWYNCTAIGGTSGFVRGSTADVVAINCLGSGASTACFSGTFNAASTTNASSDNTAPGVVNYRSQTFTFKNSGSSDYHLAGNDSGARNKGTSMVSDSAFAYNDDIDRNLLSTTWSIGFDHPVSGARNNLPLLGVG